MTDHLYERARVYRVLDALGLDRVLDGLAAFDHEPKQTFCHCFATDCFRGELAGQTRKQLGKEVTPPLLHWSPLFRDGTRLDHMNTVAARIGVSPSDVCLVFAALYEERQNDLASYVADWLAAGSYCKAGA